ncbi:hypothetical protein WJX77_011465 [Trebouxia sp. C0004]
MIYLGLMRTVPVSRVRGVNVVTFRLKATRTQGQTFSAQQPKFGSVSAWVNNKTSDDPEASAATETVNYLIALRQVFEGRLARPQVKVRSSKDCSGTSLMEEVFINQEADPYVLEVDGRLDLAALQLQPAGIVINSKKGLVDAQTSKTKRSFADIQQKAYCSLTTSLLVFGASVSIFSFDSGLCGKLIEKDYNVPVIFAVL